MFPYSSNFIRIRHLCLKFGTLFFSESLMFRTIACSQNVTPIRDTITRKITAMKANEFLSESEFVDMIECHEESSCISSATGSQYHDRLGLYFEKYSLDDKLQETEGKEIHFFINHTGHLG